MPWNCSWNVFTFKPNHASNNLFRTTMEYAKEVLIVWQKPLVTWPAIIYNGILSCHTRGQKPRVKPSLLSLITTWYRLGGAHWFSGIRGPKRDFPQVNRTPNNVKVLIHHLQFVAMLCSFWLVYWTPPTSTTSPQTTSAPGSIAPPPPPFMLLLLMPFLHSLLQLGSWPNHSLRINLF